MSSAASISAAKKRRANLVQPIASPQQQPRPMSAPSLANLTPAQRQQLMLQQQRAQQQQQQQQRPQQASQSNVTQQGQQRVPLTWPAPPIYIMKQMDTLLFQHSQSIDDIKNRLNCIDMGSSEHGSMFGGPHINAI